MNLSVSVNLDVIHDYYNFAGHDHYVHHYDIFVHVFDHNVPAQSMKVNFIEKNNLCVCACVSTYSNYTEEND